MYSEYVSQRFVMSSSSFQPASFWWKVGFVDEYFLS